MVNLAVWCLLAFPVSFFLGYYYARNNQLEKYQTTIDELSDLIHIVQEDLVNLQVQFSNHYQS